VLLIIVELIPFGSEKNKKPNGEIMFITIKGGSNTNLPKMIYWTNDFKKKHLMEKYTTIEGIVSTFYYME
jgi:hypothetical protein